MRLDHASLAPLIRNGDFGIIFTRFFCVMDNFGIESHQTAWALTFPVAKTVIRQPGMEKSSMSFSLQGAIICRLIRTVFTTFNLVI